MPSGTVDTVGTAAQVEPIEVSFEDFFLVEAGFDPKGVERLLDLAAEAALGREKGELGQLLADRAAALDHATLFEVAHEGAGDADRVNARMLVEPAVLDRDHRLGKPGRHLFEMQIGAVAVT